MKQVFMEISFASFVFFLRQGNITPYLHCSGLTPREFVRQMVLDVLETTGVTATAGIGTNLYLCKVAMDIVAKHTEPDEFGARIAQLDEISYRETLWTHRPLTDFWRIGPGYTKKLEQAGLYTMGDVARCSLGGPGDFYNEDLLYKLFGTGLSSRLIFGVHIMSERGRLQVKRHGNIIRLKLL